MQLSSQRLLYKKLTGADSSIYLDMAKNIEVMKYITGRALTAGEATERFDAMIAGNSKMPHAGFYKVIEKQDHEFIGLCKLVFINEVTAEIGYSLLPGYWGKFYATEIAGYFIERANKLSEINEVIAIVNPANIASKKLLEKHGFTWAETGFLNEQPTEIHKLKLHKIKS